MFLRCVYHPELVSTPQSCPTHRGQQPDTPAIPSLASWPKAIRALAYSSEQTDKMQESTGPEANVLPLHTWTGHMGLTLMRNRTAKKWDHCESNFTFSLALELTNQILAPLLQLTKPARVPAGLCFTQKCFLLQILTHSFLSGFPNSRKLIVPLKDGSLADDEYTQCLQGGSLHAVVRSLPLDLSPTMYAPCWRRR